MSMEITPLRDDEILLAYRNAIRKSELAGTKLRDEGAFCDSVNIALWNFYVSKLLGETRVTASAGRGYSTRVQIAAKGLLAAIRREGMESAWREVSRSALRRKSRTRQLFGTENPVEAMRRATTAIELVRDCAGEAAAVFARRSKAREQPRRLQDTAARVLFVTFLSEWLEQIGRSWLKDGELAAFASFMSVVCARYSEKLPKGRQTRSAIKTLQGFKAGAILARYRRTGQARLRRSLLARVSE
jgi:hypothetical protein